MMISVGFHFIAEESCQTNIYDMVFEYQLMQSVSVTINIQIIFSRNFVVI